MNEIAKPGRSAAVIHHPMAAAAPVVQGKRQGRFPKGVLGERVLLYARINAELDRDLLAEEIEHLRGQIQVAEQMMRFARESVASHSAALARLQRADRMTNKDRHALAQAIREQRGRAATQQAEVLRALREGGGA